MLTVMNPDAPNFDGSSVCIVDAVLPGGCDASAPTTQIFGFGDRNRNTYLKKIGETGIPKTEISSIPHVLSFFFL